jgi:hypothetical protein
MSTTDTQPLTPARTIRVHCVNDDRTTATVTITEPGRTQPVASYHIFRLAGEVRAYTWSKYVADGGERYEVVLGTRPGEPTTCTCPGHRKHGRRTVCRHVAATRALIQARKLS